MIAEHSPVGRRAATREARHERFVEQILEIFDNPANAGFTMDDISARLGINKVILYRYFGSRDGMFEQIGMRWLEQAMTSFRSDMDTAPLGDRIRVGVLAYLRMVRDHSASYRAIVNHSGPGVLMFIRVAADYLSEVMAEYAPSLDDDALRRNVWGQVFASATFQVGEVIDRDTSIDIELAAAHLASLLKPGMYAEFIRGLESAAAGVDAP